MIIDMTSVEALPPERPIHGQMVLLPTPLPTERMMLGERCARPTTHPEVVSPMARRWGADVR
jgi:hypothetical protein